MKARCEHGRPWFAECLGCLPEPSAAVPTLPFWRAMDATAQQAYVRRVSWEAYRDSRDPLTMMMARLEELQRRMVDDLNHQMFSSGCDSPRVPLPSFWRRSIQRARFYVVGVWGAVRALANALIGRAHECPDDDY